MVYQMEHIFLVFIRNWLRFLKQIVMLLIILQSLKCYGMISALCLIPVFSCGCTCGASLKLCKFQQDQRVIQFLMGLNESFSVMRGSILMRSSLPSIGQVYSLLFPEETQREIHPANNFYVGSTYLNVHSLRAGHSTGFGNSSAKKKTRI